MKYILPCMLIALCVGVAVANINAKALLGAGPLDTTAKNDKITDVAFSQGDGPTQSRRLSALRLSARPQIPARGRLGRVTGKRRRWEVRGPKSYTYRLRRLCFCDPSFVGPFLITVQNGSVVNVVFEGFGPAPSSVNVPTIDGLFNIIESSIPTVDEINVQYNHRPCYPTNISIDRIKQAADDEITYTAQIVG